MILGIAMNGSVVIFMKMVLCDPVTDKLYRPPFEVEFSFKNPKFHAVEPGPQG